MPNLKDYQKRRFYRIGAMMESFFVVLFFKLFIKKPKLSTYRSLLYKKPIISTLFFNNLAITILYLKSLFDNLVLRKKTIFTNKDKIAKEEYGNDNAIWPTQPFSIKGEIYDFEKDIEYQDKILRSYDISIKQNTLDYKNSDWWEKNVIEIRNLFFQDKKLNLRNIKNFLNLDYGFDLFEDSSPLKNINGIKKINSSFKLIYDYHRYSEYMDENILFNLNESSVGNIETLLYRNQLISNRALMLGYVVSQIKRFTDFNYESSFRFLDLGGGFGNLSRLLLQYYPKSKCVLVDLPEVCVAASYYLKSNFPNKKISLLSDINIENTFLDKKIVDSDILIIPSWAIKNLPENFVNLTLNTSSLGEMSEEFGNFYIKEIERITENYFYSSNRTDSINSIWSGFGHYKYKMKNKWMPLIYKQSPTWHLEYLGKKLLNEGSKEN